MIVTFIENKEKVKTFTQLQVEFVGLKYVYLLKYNIIEHQLEHRKWKPQLHSIAHAILRCAQI